MILRNGNLSAGLAWLAAAGAFAEAAGATPTQYKPVLVFSETPPDARYEIARVEAAEAKRARRAAKKAAEQAARNNRR